MSKIPVPDLVVLLPGITGSVLAKDGKEIWAPTGGAVLRNLLSFGKKLTQNLVVEDDDWRRADLGDGVTATRLMPDVHLLPGLWKIDGYGAIEKFLLETFDLTRGENYLPFPYDWRRDNRANAKRLQTECTTWLNRWRRHSGNDRAQLVLVGHSMGGLIARYFVEALGGWEHTRGVITFGTPFYGSLNAVNFLLNGFEKKIGPVGLDLSEALRSMRSVHQLVPSYRCVYNGQGDPKTPATAGMPGWKPLWDAALREFQQEMEDAARSIRTGSSEFAANPVTYRPIVGTDQPTLQSAVVRRSSVSLESRRGDSNEGGDGTVPLLSAALAGTEEQRTFAPEQHARIQNYDSMLAHLKGVLTSFYQVRIEDLRAAATAWFSYRSDDLYFADEPFGFELAARSDVDESLLPEVEATVTVTDRRARERILERRIRVTRQSQRFELAPLPPGTHVVEIRGRRGTAPLSDVVVVAADDELEE